MRYHHFRGTSGSILVGLFLLLSVSCTGSVDPPKEEPVASVQVTPTNDSVPVGQTLLMMATLRDADGEVLSGRTITWHSHDELVASVNPAGLVTGLEPGETVVAATSEGQSGEAGINVWIAPPPGPGLFTAITPGDDHVCALNLDGEAFCWGYGAYGQLGNGFLERLFVLV